MGSLEDVWLKPKQNKSRSCKSVMNRYIFGLNDLSNAEKSDDLVLSHGVLSVSVVINVLLCLQFEIRQLRAHLAQQDLDLAAEREAAMQIPHVWGKQGRSFQVVEGSAPGESDDEGRQRTSRTAHTSAGTLSRTGRTVRLQAFFYWLGDIWYHMNEIDSANSGCAIPEYQRLKPVEVKPQEAALA